MASTRVNKMSTLELSTVVILVEISMTRFILLLEIVEPLYNTMRHCKLSGAGKQY
jgi:hypothetical protein